MMDSHITMRIELSPIARESLGKLTAEICALRDRLEQLEIENVDQIGKAIQNCIYHLLVLQNGLKTRT